MDSSSQGKQLLANSYSARNASIGFTLAARRAGRYAASSPLANSSTAAPASVQPSCAFTP